MTPELREKHRQIILVTLLAVYPLGMGLSAISTNVSTRGFPDDDEITAGELAYLEKQGLACPKEKTISPAARRWRITDAGVEYLEKEGLA